MFCDYWAVYWTALIGGWLMGIGATALWFLRRRRRR
jgi:LPXTG-motif cell wall-anchored protein